MEPKFAVTDRLTLGLRLETRGLFSLGRPGGFLLGAMQAFGAVLAKAEHAFTDGPVRPFVSVGIGYYAVGRIDFDAVAGMEGVAREGRARAPPQRKPERDCGAAERFSVSLR